MLFWTTLFAFFATIKAGVFQLDTMDASDPEAFQRLMARRELQGFGACNCELSDNAFVGDCPSGLLQRKESEWCYLDGETSFCCADTDNECCEPTGAGIAIGIIFWIVVISIIVLASCACCKCCPLYEKLCCVGCCGPKENSIEAQAYPQSYPQQINNVPQYPQDGGVQMGEVNKY